jgi:transcriptional regulator with XRE-family HTH domain
MSIALRPAGTLSGLARQRVDLGLSRSEAARLTGVSRRQLARLEAEPLFSPAAVRLALTYVALRVLIDSPPFFGSNGKEAT